MRRKVIIIAILSIIYIIIFPVIREFFIEAPYTFTIEAMGQKNEDSGGTEVWIDGVYRDGERLGIEEIRLSDGWENVGRIYSSGEDNSSLKICIKSKEETVIVFVTHPYSGLVKITNPEGDTEIIDLYSSTDGIYSYVYKIKAK